MITTEEYFAAQMAYAERLAYRTCPDGPDSVQWWVGRFTERCAHPESSLAVDLFESYAREVREDTGSPLGLHAWSACVAHLGFPAGNVWRPSLRKVERVRKGLRLH